MRQLLTGGGIGALVATALQQWFKDEISNWQERRKQRYEDKRTTVSNCRWMVSKFKSTDPKNHESDFTDTQAYLAISRHLLSEKRKKIEDRANLPHVQNLMPRLTIFNEELDRLATKWNIPL